MKQRRWSLVVGYLGVVAVSAVCGLLTSHSGHEVTFEKLICADPRPLYRIQYCQLCKPRMKGNGQVGASKESALRLHNAPPAAFLGRRSQPGQSHQSRDHVARSSWQCLEATSGTSRCTAQWVVHSQQPPATTTVACWIAAPDLAHHLRPMRSPLSPRLLTSSRLLNGKVLLHRRRGSDASNNSHDPQPESRGQRGTKFDDRHYREAEPGAQVEEGRPNPESGPVEHWICSEHDLSDLATVDEGQDAAQRDSSAVEAVEAEQQAAFAEGSDEDEENTRAAASRRISTHSGYSGTTAKTSFSQEQISELDPDIMVADLPIAASTAEELARQFLPNDRNALRIIWKEIRTPSSRSHKLYRTRVATFDLCSQSFGQQDYIQPSFVLRALLRVASTDDVPAGPWRPDSVIYRINLIRMMRNVLIKSPNPTDFMDHDLDDLVMLDDFFPNAIAGSNFDDETLKMCLAIQTQVALARLMFHQDDPSFSANETISNVFLSVNEDHELVYKHIEALELAVGDENARDLWSRLINPRITELRSAFRRSHEHAITTLRVRHTWESFVDQLITYYQVRKHQLDHDIALAGGASLIIETLVREVQRRSATRAAAIKRESLVKAGSTPQKSVGKGAMARLKARDQERRQSELGVLGPDMYVDHTIDVDEDNFQLLEETTDNVLTDVDRNVVEPQNQTSQADTQRPVINPSEIAEPQAFQEATVPKRKERARFTDEQPNAVRVEWDDASQATQPAVNVHKSRPLPPSSSAPQMLRGVANKRTIREIEDDDAEDEFDPTQDEGFQTDTRSTIRADERRAQAAAAAFQKAATQPTSSAHADPTRPERSPAPPAGPAKRQRRNPGSIIPPSTLPDDDDEELPSSTAFEQAKILAKQNRMHFNTRSGPQQRQAWTVDEEEALFDLIHDHGAGGISYAVLKAIDNNAGQEARLGRRSAEQMRFKARNMKQTFLRSAVSFYISHPYLCLLTRRLRGREALPRNFEHIVLDKKAIDDLRARGIRYEQERIRGVS
nr:hypothetical protein CFP56_21955 [Quercus suber]